MSAGYHLAQVNVARLLAPLDSAQLGGFLAALEPINALAERSPGFVWRLQTEAGDATAIRPYDDDMILVNMSLWESAEALADFTYRSGHREVMRRRREWFEQMAQPYLALWWVPAGHLPGLEEAKHRLALIRRDGPSPAAFTFRKLYPMGGGEPISVGPPPGVARLGPRPC